MLDPYCGSGHFLVEAFHLLVPLRMHDEGLSAKAACDAVLSQNLFGLELDLRCTQIAAFAMALAAWKYSDESSQPSGYRPLPTLNIACSGQSVIGKKEEWLALANDDSRLIKGMDKLYDLFRQALHLGSLIDPLREDSDLLAASFADLQPLLEHTFSKEKIHQNADAAAVGVAAQGIAKAAELLASHYTLAAINVPYLGYDKQNEFLKSYCRTHFKDSKADLAICFAERLLQLCTRDGTAALVSPQSWLYQDSFKKNPPRFIKNFQWNFISQLGSNAFETISGEVVNVCLAVITREKAGAQHQIVGVDVTQEKTSKNKLLGLINSPFLFIKQVGLLKNPQYRITFEDLSSSSLLAKYATSHLGICTGDYPRFSRFFWEVDTFGSQWTRQHSTVATTCLYGGMERVLKWENSHGDLMLFLEARLGCDGVYQWPRGQEAWGKPG